MAEASSHNNQARRYPSAPCTIEERWYDTSGNLGYHEDLFNDVSYRYFYDVSDRLMKITDSYGNSTAYKYDLDDNLSEFTELINGTTYTTTYQHDMDNRPTELMRDDLRVN